MILPFEPGCSYIASSSVVSDISYSGELAWHVEFMDLFFPVVKLTPVKWTPTGRLIR